MHSLRHLLLVAVLCFAQFAAAAHAVGHAVGDEGALPTHTCELCLAAHDLGAALPSLVALPPVVAACGLSVVPHGRQRSAWPAPAAVQRGPPRT